MTFDLYATAFAAGMLYVLIPGPATLAALNLSATVGRLACTKFLGAHLAGDLFWSGAAIFAVVGISQLGPRLFSLLGLICGLYLIFLGVKALRQSGTDNKIVISSPVRTGLIFGFTNPKAYPFAVAMFTAVFARFEEAMSFSLIVPLVISAFSGFVIATGLVVFWTGLPIIGRTFQRYRRWIMRAIGVVFILFGCKSVHDAASGFRLKPAT